MRAFFAISCFEHFFSEKTYIDDADHPAPLVHDRKREEFVEDEKFARLQYSCGRWNGDHAPNHDFFQARFQRGCQQAPCRQNSNETFLGIDREEVDHPFSYAFAPDAIERPGDTHVRIEQRKIFARVINNQRVKIRTADRVIHPFTCSTSATLVLSHEPDFELPSYAMHNAFVTQHFGSLAEVIAHVALRANPIKIAINALR